MSGVALEPLIAASAGAAVRQKALSLGFDAVGFAPATPSPRGEAFRGWLEGGQAGTMRYLHERVEERIDPGAYLPDAETVICVATNYHVPLSTPIPTPANQSVGRIARYALGDDYHTLIKDRLYDLADWLRETFPGSRTRCAVDTAPVLEKDLAARAGLGWIGKNTLLISPKLGSYVLLGEVLTTLPLPADELVADHCGSCRRCLDACPTGAITEPYHLDARRCISYLTVEHRPERPIEHDTAQLDTAQLDTVQHDTVQHDTVQLDTVQLDTGDWLFGCDICQEVCPWNFRPPVATDPALQPRFPTGTLDAGVVADWTSEQYQQQLRGSAMKRVKLPQLQANARRVLGANRS